MRPIIAIAPEVKVVDGREVVVVDRNYIDRVIDAGGLPIILPVITHNYADSERRLDVELSKMLDGVDGLIIPGGGDIDADLYHDNPEHTCDVFGDVDRFIVKLIVQATMRDHIPVLGICGGMQRIAIAYGGSLHQDVAKSSNGAVMIDHRQKATSDRVWHDVRVAVGSKLHRLMFDNDWASMTKVNSFHHQSVNVCPDCFNVVARSEDGSVEAIEYDYDDKSYIVGVQWHPEAYLRRGYESYDQVSQRLFRNFISLCDDRKTARDESAS